MRLDPRQLKLLLAVIRTGSFSAAARDLGLSQPGVSQQVSHLEHVIGARLLDRTRKGAKPTRMGLILARRAEMLETVLELGQQEVSLGLNEIGGPIVIAGTPGALMSVVPGAVGLLERRGLRSALRVVEAADDELFGLLRAFKADLIVSTIGVVVPPSDLIQHHILTDPFVLVMRADREFDARHADLETLATLDLVLPDLKGAFKQQIESIFLNKGVPLPQHGIRCDSLAMTKEIVRRSDHIGILPSRVVAAEVVAGQLRVVPVTPSPPPRAVGATLLRDRPYTVLVEAVLDAMREAAGAEAP